MNKKQIIFADKTGLIIRNFSEEDAIACEQIFQANLKKYYDLSQEQRNAMLSVNKAENFVEISKRFFDRLFVLEKNGRIVGYVHFGREKQSIRVKRFQSSEEIRYWGKTLTKIVLPIIERYRIRWKCKTIGGEMGDHLKRHIPALKKLGFKVLKPKIRVVQGIGIGFVPVKWEMKRKKRFVK